MTLRTVGEVPTYDFPVRDHLEIGEALGAIDMERGAKVSGAALLLPHRPGALLEFALVQLAISRAVAAGFTPVIAPALVRPEAMEGTGFLGEHDEEVYRIERDDLYLVGTSEVALAGMHSDEVLDLSAGPGATPAGRPASAARPAPTARTPAASSACTGSTRSRCSASAAPEEAAAEHLRLLQWEEEFLQALELPYRVVDIAAGDLGTSATRKYDIEAWFPSQGTYRELTSTSDCTHLPGPPAQHPLPRRRRQAADRPPRSTARCARSPAPSPACSRCTSRPTARCTCRPRCARGSAASRSSRPG